MKLTSNNALVASIFLSLLVLIAIFSISSTQKKRLDDEARRITAIIKKNTFRMEPARHWVRQQAG